MLRYIVDVKEEGAFDDVKGYIRFVPVGDVDNEGFIEVGWRDGRLVCFDLSDFKQY